MQGRCDQRECAGSALEGNHCLAHLAASEHATVVQRLRAGDPLTARNTTIGSEPLDALLDALRSDGDRLTLPATDFRGTTFSGYADFRGATFDGPALFEGATFAEYARFDSVTFSGYAGFGAATVNGDADFDRATFAASAVFDHATFRGSAHFGGATFRKSARFGNATFDGRAGFGKAAVSGDPDLILPEAAGFEPATFRDDAVFVSATFGDDALFGSATFDGGADFGEATFGGIVALGGASFGERATFAGATFHALAGLGWASFRGPAEFMATTLGGDSLFEKATFDGGAYFGAATFGGDAVFREATFAAEASFAEATFTTGAFFDGTTFGAVGDFAGADFGGAVGFDAAAFAGDALFGSATFERARRFGTLEVGQRLVLDDCIFAERVRIDVAASMLSARATTFAAGAHLGVASAEVALDDADFARPSTVSGALTPRLTRLQHTRTDDDRQIWPTRNPRLVTVRGAHVTALSLSDVDLRACRFLGAHGLESLHIESSCQWSRTPTTRWYVDRDTIAEEHQLRAYPWEPAGVSTAKWRWGRAARGWDDPYTRAPPWLEGRDDSTGVPLQPSQIAALYRALRKSREDDKYQAGAGDLYYGEMEMRSAAHARTWGRLAPEFLSQGRRVRGDRVILRLYWLLSGYGLRPARALGWLAVTLLIGAAMLWWFGFREPHTYGRSLLFAFESSLSLLRPPEASLGAGGEIVQIVLRLLGPLLFGLALLAVRARVKR